MAYYSNTYENFLIYNADASFVFQHLLWWRWSRAIKTNIKLVVKEWELLPTLHEAALKNDPKSAFSASRCHCKAMGLTVHLVPQPWLGLDLLFFLAYHSFLLFSKILPIIPI